MAGHDEEALDAIAALISRAATTGQRALENGGMADRIPSIEEVYDRIASLYVCVSAQKSPSAHHYPFLVTTAPDGSLGVFLEIGRIPRAVFAAEQG